MNEFLALKRLLMSCEGAKLIMRLKHLCNNRKIIGNPSEFHLFLTLQWSTPTYLCTSTEFPFPFF